MAGHERLRVLYVLPYFPFSLRSGSSFRACNIIRGLARRHEVHVVCLGLDYRTDPAAKSAEDLCASITVISHRHSRVMGVLKAIATFQPYDLTTHRNTRFAAAVARLVEELHPHIVYYSRLPGAQYLHRYGDSVHVADQHDLAEAYWTIATHGARSPLLRAFARFNGPIATRYERQIYGQFDGVVSVSAVELLRTQQILPPTVKTFLLQNGADTDYFSPTPGARATDSKSIVLVGAMNAQRNVDAAIRFAEEVFPRILRLFPDAVFQIVGHNPSPSVVQLGLRPGIRVTGEVDDVRPYLEQAGVVVAPFYSGSGVKHKVTIAMSMAKACVVTSNAAQGLLLVHQENCLMADDDELFAQHVCSILADQSLSVRPGQAARQLILDEYSWNTLVQKLDNWLCALTKH